MKTILATLFEITIGIMIALLIRKFVDENMSMTVLLMSLPLLVVTIALSAAAMLADQNKYFDVLSAIVITCLGFIGGTVYFLL